MRSGAGKLVIIIWIGDDCEQGKMVATEMEVKWEDSWAVRQTCASRRNHGRTPNILV